jgi:replicative DNA helicase
MSKDQLIDRLISSESNIDSWKIRQGMLSSEGEDNDFVCIQHALGVLSEPQYLLMMLQVVAFCK